MSAPDLTRELPPETRERAAQSLMAAILRYLPGQRLEVRVRRMRRQRSDLQNRALWGCAYKALTEQTGNDPEDLHTYFCGRFFGWQEYDVMGLMRKRPVRTTTRDERGNRDVIDRGVMAEFYDFIQRESAMAGFDVPDPDPEWWTNKEQAA